MSAAGGELRGSRNPLWDAAIISAELIVLLSLGGAAAAQGVSGPRATEPSLGVAVRVDFSGDPLPDYAVARLGTNRFRHPGHISHIALSRDESFVVTVGASNIAHFWKLPSGELLQTITGPSHWRDIDFVALSPNNKLVALASFTKGSDVVVFDRESRKELWQDNTADHFPDLPIEYGTTFVGSLSFSFDGNLVVLAINSYAFSWKAADGKEKLSRQGIPVLAYDPVSNTVFSLEKDGSDIWNESLTTGSRRKAWPPPKEEMFPGELTISSNGRWAIHVRDSRLERRRSAFVVDLAKGSVVHKWEYDPSLAGYFRFVGAEPFLVRGIPSSFEFYDLSREPSFDAPTFLTPNLPFTLSAITPRRRLLIGANYNKVMLFDLAKGETVPSVSHPDRIREAWFSPDGRWIATALPGDLRMWNAQTGQHNWERRDRNLTFLGFSSDSKGAVLADKDALHWHDQQNGELRTTVLLDKALPRIAAERGPFAYSSRKNVYACVDGARLMLVDARTGKQCGEGSWNRNKLEHSQFSPSGNYLLTVSEDWIGRNDILLWDIRRLESPKRLDCATKWVISATFDPGDGYLALLVPGNESGSRRILHVVELATGEIVVRRPVVGTNDQNIRAIGFYDEDTLALSPLRDDKNDINTPDLVLMESLDGKTSQTSRIPAFRFFDAGARLLLTDDLISGRVPEVVAFEERKPPSETVRKDVTNAQLVRLWEQLASDSSAAEDAVRRLRQSNSRQVATFLKSRVLPTPAHSPATIRRVVAEMASGDATTVERARRRLTEIGVQALPVIRQVLHEGVDSDTGVSLREIHRTISHGAWSDADDVRALRALRALSGNRSPEARKLLGDVAAGAGDARRTLVAKEALRSLAELARNQ